MSEPKIITNRHPRLVLDWNQLTPKEQAELAYHDPADPGAFVRYKGWAYDLGDMERSNVAGWDMQVVDTYFSAVLFRYVRDADGDVACMGQPDGSILLEPIDMDHVICGLYFC